MRIALIAAACALLLGGCAATSVNRARDVSSAGIQYAQTTSAVVTLAIDSSIDADSEAQIRARPRPAELETPDVRAKMLETSDSALVDSTIYYAKLRASIGTLEAYFRALQALADGSQADATQEAVRTLGARVNSLNQTLEAGSAKVKPVLTPQQITAISGLGKAVATEVHGALVAAALRRDAETVGRALALQQQVLIAAQSDISERLTEANNRFYVDSVLKPYQTAAIDTAWAENRKRYIKIRALGQTLDAVKSAQAASNQMLATWARIVSGETSSAELLAMLRETDELLAAVNAVKAANAAVK